MRDYIILNNKNSNEIKGLLIQNLPPITKPRIRAEIEEIDGRDGDIVTPLGYGAYDKTFSIGLYGNFDINEVIKYFDSEGIVVFSNEPNKYYNYKILEQIDFEKLIRFRTADVMMHVQPFKYSTTEGKETEEMETKTASGSEIDLPDTNNEKLQMEKLKGDTHQDTIDAEEGNENEDTNLAVNDVDPSKENYITLKGNTTQDQHESPNLLQITAPATQEFYGITITNNGDGTITLNGTATNLIQLYLPNLDMATHYLGIKKDTDYFLNGCMAGGSLNTYNFIIEGETWYADTGNGVQFNSHSDSAVHVYLSIASGVTLDNAIFKPMLIEGTEAQEFEPYGKVTPSPDYPSEVKVVKGENVVSVSGKNLLEYTLASLKSINTQGTWNDNVYSWNNITFTINADLSILVNGTATAVTYLYLTSNVGLTSENEYILNGCSSGGTLSSYSLRIYNGNSYHGDIGNGYTFTYSNEDYVRINISNHATANNLVFCPMIRLSNITDDTYVPYSKTDYPISLGNIELCKIGDYKDYLFKRNGKWYVHKIIKKILLNGSENWTKAGTSFQASRATSDIGYKDLSFSNIYKFNPTHTGASTAFNNYEFGYNTTGVLTIRDDRFTITDDFKTWLSNNNVTLYYILVTPTEEEITDTSLIAQLDNLHTAELQETSYINSTPAKEYPYINLKYNVVTPAPSPDRASEINKVTGNNVVSVQGKNLLNNGNLNYTYSNVYPSENTLTSISTGIRYATTRTSGTPFILFKLFDMKKYLGKTIRMKANFTSGGIRLVKMNEDGTIRNIVSQTQVSGETISYTIPSDLDEVQHFLGYNLTLNATEEQTTDFTNLILTINNEDMSFTPYVSQNYPINLGTLELCKIGDYQDYLYKNNGKWYVHKEVGKYIFSSGDNIRVSGSNYYTNISPKPLHAQAYMNTYLYDNRTSGFNNMDNYYFGFEHTGIFHIKNTDVANKDEMKQSLIDTNSYLVYVLATPTEEEITDETLLAQLEALDNIYNQKGTTKIKTNPEGNNMPLDLDVSYTESRPITITNSGNIYSKPIFTIYGEGNIGVYLNDIQLFDINLGSEEQITIDVAEMQAYNKETKVLKNRLVTGSYDSFVLKVGENKISFSGIVKKFEIENYSRWI